jgi:O-antigen ligase
MDLVVFGVAPAPPSVVMYMRIYFLRQAIPINGIPVPRMGGLFVEAPPFGLFMFSMLAALCVMRKNGFRTREGAWGIAIAAVGVLLSMADQVLLGALLSLLLSLPFLGKGRTRLMWIVTIGLAFTLGAFEIRSLTIKEMASGSQIATEINGSSIGERSFHFHYGMSLLQNSPVATILGIGPGRYGEYVAETGNYPDTVNMQTSEPEILVEWGVVGLLVWVILFCGTTVRIWAMHRTLGIGLILGLILADSFQANWKYEAVFLAIATLCTGHSVASVKQRNDAEHVVLNELPGISGAEA